MKLRWTRFVAAVAISLGLSMTGWGQEPPAGPPGPLPTPTPLPPPTPADPGAAPAPGIIVSPGTIGSGNSCGVGGLIPGGCLDWLLPHCGCGQWIAGGGVYFMAPVWNNNPAFTTSKTALVGGVPTTTNAQTNFSTKMSIGPTAFAGYMWENGWGIRFRWFQIEQDNSATTTLDGATTITDAGGQRSATPAVAGTLATAGSHLYLSAYDLEATYLAVFGRWTVLGSAGARYAQINQGYGFNTTDTLVPPNALTSAVNHNFNGFGPTASIEGHYQIGDWGFGVYGSARGSILFGSGNISSVGSSSVFIGDPAFVNGTSSQTTVIPVGELEIGGEWSRTCGRFRFFAQVGVVGQIWWGAGNPSYGLYLNGPNLSSGGAPSNLGFIGGVARAGIAF